MEKSIIRSTENILLGDASLTGDLHIPEEAHALVIFAHGSGSSRLSPRNQQVAAYLNRRGISTLLFDLLTVGEDLEPLNRFNITLLASRLGAVTEWIREKPACRNMQFGYFGASTGSAAALMAAPHHDIAAVVSRGGRPDLATSALSLINCPVLLIVGELDKEVIRLNQIALQHMYCEKRLDIVPCASHLFEEKGAMEKVAALSAEWFELFLQPTTINKH